MEIDIEQELQILKSEYNTLKKELKKQDTLNEKFFKSIRKQPALAVSKEIKSRMWLDILTIPAVMIICLNTNFPILFGILVSLWALADLGISLWVSRKLGMDDLLNDDVRTVTEKIAGYRKFYDWALIGSILPLIVMLTYIFMHLYARADNPAAVQLITVSGIVFIILAIANTLFQYKKHVQRCKELLKQFEE
ncbi:hypothetical protein [Phocaeicola coprocola]|jgi:hypothetical protein|uniref:hypothetical protein n=1 Tax=Phocaeicola coprocola TaxID=310298 RepID=UPI00195E701E|nr:hypothetical protein [Phocaeicola coprocola]MBM6713013.1 hypothetical protein [Phocaeicola coprocola]